MASVGEWEDFAPPEESKNEPPPGALTVKIEEVVDDVTYVCTETPYSLTETPGDIVRYEPNASIMWVGNLIQGDSYKNGTGSFEELSIRQRAALKLSIDLLTGGNFAIVDEPSRTTELRETLSEENIKVTAIGGEGINVLNLISEGNLKAYFIEDAALTSAKPLSYQLNFLGDNTIAKVAENSEYTLGECEVKIQSKVHRLTIPCRRRSANEGSRGFRAACNLPAI